MNKILVDQSVIEQALETFEPYGEKYPHIITALREALAEQAEQEPVGEVLEGGYEVRLFDRLPEETPLYAAPVRTKDLTEAELHQIWRDIKSLVGLYSFQEIARAVIQEYRRKNGIV